MGDHHQHAAENMNKSSDLGDSVKRQTTGDAILFLNELENESPLDRNINENEGIQSIDKIKMEATNKKNT